jgi:hypothetical protein
MGSKATAHYNGSMAPNRQAPLPVAIALAVVLAGAAAGAAEAVLVLDDGQEIRGVDLERDPAGAYVLTLATGAKLSLPASLVVEVRLSAEGAPSEPETPPVAEPREPPEPEVDPGPEPPTGFEVGEGRERAGSPTDGRTPPVSERLAALPESGRSRFRGGAFDPTWTPSSDWDASTDVTQFNPARWYRAPIDATWTPRSAFGSGLDVLAGSRATFQRSILDPTWAPTNGFRRSRDEESNETVTEAPPLIETGGRYVPEVRFDEP